MKRIYYNKLVRDKIPDKIRGLGETTEVYEMTDNDEYLQELRKKLQEEALELSTSMTKESVKKELGDLLIVVDHLLQEFDISDEEIASVKEASIQKKGSFAKRFFMKWSSNETYEAGKKKEQ